MELTERGQHVLEQAPTLIREEFIDQFTSLDEYEQSAILSALQRVAEMMSSDTPDTSPSRAEDGESSTSPANH